MIKLLALNDVDQLISPFFPKTVKNTILGVSVAANVASFASCYFSKDPVVSGLSTVLLFINVVAWLDLGASEKVKGYEASFEKEARNEEAEGTTIQTLNSELKTVKKNLLLSQKALEDIERENTELQRRIEESQPEIDSLKKTNQESNLILESFIQEVEGQRKRIQELERIELTQKEDVEKYKSSIKKVRALVKQLEDKIVEKEEQITTLNSRVEDLTSQLGSARK